jgi:hypothetical protein
MRQAGDGLQDALVSLGEPAMAPHIEAQQAEPGEGGEGSVGGTHGT